MPNSTYKFFLGLLFSAAAIIAGFVVYRNYAERKPKTPIGPEIVSGEKLNFPLGDFTLTDRFGQEFHASDLLGEVWVGSFFYTECSGACVMLNSQITQLIKEDFAGDSVKFVSISVDPQNDTVASLNDYARNNYVEAKGIDPKRWIFLTQPEGRVSVVENIAMKNFKASSGKITHSDRLILVDRQGNVRASVSSSFDVEVARFKKRLREILDEQVTPGEQAAAAAAANSNSQGAP